MNFEHADFNIIKKILVYKNSSVIPQTNFLFNIILSLTISLIKLRFLTNYHEISKLKSIKIDIVIS